MMEQQHSLAGMGGLLRPDFAGGPTAAAAAAINNNTAAAASHAFKEATTAATIMSHLLKVRQEMVALNMSKDSDSDDCRRSESPTHISDSELAEEEAAHENQRHRAINLGGRSSLSSASSGGSEVGAGGCEPPLSPASEGGHSTESAKEQKASRLENIVGGLVRSSPLPPITASNTATITAATTLSTTNLTQGCKKRKLYQPMQHETALDLDTKEKRRQTLDEEDEREEDEEEEEKEEPELKRKKEVVMESQLKSMQDQIARIQAKFQHNTSMSHNDENADPEGELEIDLSTSAREVSDRNRLHHFNEVTIEKKINVKPFGFGPLHPPPHPLLNGSAEPLPPFPPAPQLHLGSHPAANYVDIAKRFLQDQQDKITKELITKDILGCTINRHADIADKLAAISPELEGLADILKSEITTSLTIIVESIVQRFLAARRQPLTKFADENNANNNNSSSLAAAAAAAFRHHHHQQENGGREKPAKTPSGRAPQVRDRATPRTVSQPLSMANPLSLSNALNTANSGLLLSSSCSSPKLSMLPTMLADSNNSKPPAFSPFPHYPPAPHHHQANNNGSLYSDDELGRDEEEDDEPQLHQHHQDDAALNLVVTPKKRRHKVTDTRITPRTVSRLLGSADQPQPITTMADQLQKHFGGHFAAAGLPPHHPAAAGAFPGLARPPFLPPSLLPTSLNGDHFPFNPFGFPGHLSANRPSVRDLSPPSGRRPRSVSPRRDTSRPPPPLLHHPASLLTAGGGQLSPPDFSAAMKAEMERPASGASSSGGTEDLTRFDTPGGHHHHPAFSLASMAGE
jgi:hypothetical protein